MEPSTAHTDVNGQSSAVTLVTRVTPPHTDLLAATTTAPPTSNATNLNRDAGTAATSLLSPTASGTTAGTIIALDPGPNTPVEVTAAEPSGAADENSGTRLPIPVSKKTVVCV